MFKSLVPYIKERLVKHHEIYSARCKAEYWEENLAYALRQAGFGSDWKPNFNHKSGLDQTTDSGIRIGNKSGKLKKDYIEITGSRLTSHKTLEDKLEFLSVKTEDYIFCLGAKTKDWDTGKKIYYFIVIDSNKLNYHKQEWFETIGKEGTLTGWKTISENYTAKITKKMSDQLITCVKLGHCEEIHEITIG
jgi:hypothetical protein